MSKTMTMRLPVINLEKPVKLDKAVVMIPVAKYTELIDDLADLRDALKAEEEYRQEGGKPFLEYDKQRKKKRH